MALDDTEQGEDILLCECRHVTSEGIHQDKDQWVADIEFGTNYTRLELCEFYPKIWTFLSIN